MPRSTITGAPSYLPQPTASDPGWVAVTSTTPRGVKAMRYVRAGVYAVRESVLQLRFGDGSHYTYWNISESEWDDIFSASSKGSWVWDNLRGRRKGSALKPYRPGLHYN